MTNTIFENMLSRYQIATKDDLTHTNLIFTLFQKNKTTLVA